MTVVPIDNGAAARKLAASDPVLAGIIKGVGPCPLTPTPDVDLFQALLRSIIFQSSTEGRRGDPWPRRRAHAGGERRRTQCFARDFAARCCGALRQQASRRAQSGLPR